MNTSNPQQSATVPVFAVKKLIRKSFRYLKADIDELLYQKAEELSNAKRGGDEASVNGSLRKEYQEVFRPRMDDFDKYLSAINPQYKISTNNGNYQSGGYSDTVKGINDQVNWVLTEILK